MVAPKGATYRASLIVASKRVKDATTTATARLYADDFLIATSKFKVKINAVAVSSGTVKLEEIVGAGQQRKLVEEHPAEIKDSMQS